MKNFTRLFSALITVLLLSAAANAADAVPFPERDDAWLKEGTFPNVENLHKMMPGLTKTQVYALLQEPHFSEGFFGVREWNYIFNFRTGKGNEFITCQYQVRYGNDGKVQSTHWKEHECDDLVNPSEPVAAGPTVTEHFNVDDDVLFAFDKSSEHDMLPGGREALDNILSRIKSGFSRLTAISIIGYTDRIGSVTHNQELSLARAQTVRDYLTSHGLPKGPVTIAGAGSSQPVAKGCPAGAGIDAVRCLQPDRRVTIDVTGQKNQQ